MVYKNQIKKTGENGVSEYNWDNSADLILKELTKIEQKESYLRVYYANFRKNLWNNDNRENIIRYAPGDVVFVDEPDTADLQLVDITRLSDAEHIQCKNYIAHFHCHGEWSEENIKDYKDIFDKAVMVYTHLDVKGFDNLVRGPWGTDPFKFYYVKEAESLRIRTILNTGEIPQTEGIAECVKACEIIGGQLLHVGPNLGYRSAAYQFANNLTIDQMRSAYHTVRYVSGLRRVEGFEKPVIEGLLCGAKPICFDTPLYRYWYDGLARFVKEGTFQETTDDITKIFQEPYKAVTDEEREKALKKFSWKNVAKTYWNSVMSAYKKKCGGV